MYLYHVYLSFNILTYRIGRFEAVPDNLSPEEILAQAQAAAKDAAEMLTLRQPRSKVSYTYNMYGICEILL